MMVITCATAQHLAQIVQIETQSFADPWSDTLLRQMVSSPDVLFNVALLDGRVVGYIVLRTIQDEAEIYNLAIVPVARRQGIARQLLQNTLCMINGAGVCAVYLEVRAKNIAAIQLYQAAGFAQVGVRPGYYTNPADDAILMCLLSDPRSEDN